MTPLDDLPEVGWRAPWYSDAAWRDALLVALPGHRCMLGPEGLHVDGAIGELSLHLYHQGLFVLPPDATPAELLEAAMERSLEPLESAPN